MVRALNSRFRRQQVHVSRIFGINTKVTPAGIQTVRYPSKGHRNCRVHEEAVNGLTTANPILGYCLVLSNISVAVDVDARLGEVYHPLIITNMTLVIMGTDTSGCDVSSGGGLPGPCRTSDPLSVAAHFEFRLTRQVHYSSIRRITYRVLVSPTTCKVK